MHQGQTDNDQPRAWVVLYLEDDDATAYLFQKALHEAGVSLQLFRVTDGEQALAFLMREGVYREAPSPQLVILDINVPKKSGLEVLAAMRELGEGLASTPAVVLTTSMLSQEQERAYALGANKCFVKSRDWDDYTATAREVCSLLPRNSS